MTVTQFQEKIAALREKAGMNPDIRWPIVYDQDEKGELFVDEAGAIFLADKRCNWVASHLNLETVENIRYKLWHGVSHIYVNFASGDSLEFRAMKLRNNRLVVLTDVNILRTEANARIADQLKASCDTGSEANENAVYVKVI